MLKFLKNKPLRLKEGFTLVEMIFTLAVISILASIIVGYSHQSETETNLIRAVNQFVLDIQRAQHLAMLVYEEEQNQTQKVCGWGIYFSDSTGNLFSPLKKYLIFADSCDPSSLKGNQIYDSSEEKKEEREILKGVEISAINIKSLVFVPPEPIVVFNPSLGSNGEAAITFRLTDNPQHNITVFITTAGQIKRQVNF